MNEVQGPTPTGTSRPYKSLAEALRAHRVPAENHDLVAAIVDAAGISTFIDRGRYIEAIRRGDGAPLHIGKMYTNGFAEDEQILVGGRALPLAPSEGRPPYFFVTHPSALPGARAAGRTASGRGTSRAKTEPRAVRATKPAERDYGVCEVCFMVRTPSGGCACD